ncbi:MAG: universal stress protein [Desulfopila sp.]
MSKASRRILLAVDGSDQAYDVISYVAAATPPVDTEIVLYTVLGKIPETFWDIGRELLWQERVETAHQWERRQLDLAIRCTGRALQIFKEYGFVPGQVTTKISPQLEGIARDIIDEARQGYDVLAIGRGRLSSGQDQPLGSVASKIINAPSTPALWLIGSKVRTGKVLISMDHSVSGLPAVRHSASFFNRNDTVFTLFHVIRGIATISPPEMADIFPIAYQQQLLRDAELEIRPVMEKAKTLLNSLDIAADRIDCQIVTGACSRAAAIIDAARGGGYGTIVVGRRGLTRVADFTMGRVTNKLIQMIRQQTLCIVE